MRIKIKALIEERLKAPKPEKRVIPRHCTNCGGSGHNKQTCPIPKYAVKPDIPLMTLRRKDPDRKLTAELKMQAKRESQVGMEFWLGRKSG